MQSDACAEFTAARVPGQVLDFAHQLHKARGVILGINGASLAMADYINSQRPEVKPRVPVAYATLIMSVEHQLLMDCAAIMVMCDR
jgi:hypothetical protein